MRYLWGYKYVMTQTWNPDSTQRWDISRGEARPDIPMTWFYGDSFVMDCSDLPTWFGVMAQRFSPWVCYRSEAGSGPEWAILRWNWDHRRGLHRSGDRVVIALSEPGRLYLRNRISNHATALDGQIESEEDVAVKMYYQYLQEQQLPVFNIRMKAMCMWLDQQLKDSTVEHVIAQSFPAYPKPGDHWATTSSDLNTNWHWHWFENARNIWPSLSYWTVTDPTFRGFGDAEYGMNRPAHIGLEQHQLIADLIEDRIHKEKDLIIADPPQGSIPMCPGV